MTDEEPLLSLNWVDRRTVSRIALRVAEDTAARAPTRLELSWPGGKRTVTLNGNGGAHFAPFTTRETEGPGQRHRTGQQPRVRLLSQCGAGRYHRAAPRRRAVPARGHPHRRDHVPVRVRPDCGGQRRDPAHLGENQLRVARVRGTRRGNTVRFHRARPRGRDQRRRRARLGALRASLPGPRWDARTAAPPRPSPAATRPTRYDERCGRPTRRDVLVLRENVNPGWSATQGGRSLRPQTVDGWQQGWWTTVVGRADHHPLRARPALPRGSVRRSRPARAVRGSHRGAPA